MCELGYSAEYFPYPVPFQFPERRIFQKTYDVSFIGAIEGKKNRKEYIEFLRTNGIQVYAPGEKNIFLEREKYYQTFCQSKINLCFCGTTLIPEVIKRFPDTSRVKCLLGRVHEIISTGNFCLTEYSTDISHFYQEDLHLATFKSEQDLLDKILFFLREDKIRGKISNDAYEYYLKNFDSSIIGEKLSNLFDSYKEKLFQTDEILWNSSPLMKRYLTSVSVQKILIKKPSLIKFFL